MARILVIDDERDFQRLVMDMLEVEGYEVTGSPDGSAGLRLLETHPFDLVITDIIMPNLDGLEVIEKIKSKYPQIKVIAISGGGGMKIDDCLKLAASVGANAVLPKPIERKEFVALVHEVLSERG